MDEGVKRWLSDWERAIRERDFDAGRALFDEAASGFGTVTERTWSREELVDRQWRPVWSRTTGFAFDSGDLEVRISQDGTMATAHGRWSSKGVDTEGTARERLGRCTIVLARPGGDAPWRCIHTHFSMWPEGGDEPLRDLEPHR
jgi:ketosteroid isomerase-like protein